MSLFLLLSATFVCVVGVVLFVIAVTKLRRWDEAHHGVWGLLAFQLGVIGFLVGAEALGALVACVGALAVLDDGAGHLYEWESGDRAYRSPGHRLVYALFPGLAKL